MLETKLFPDWKPLMIMRCYIHQSQQTNTGPRHIIDNEVVTLLSLLLI